MFIFTNGHHTGFGILFITTAVLFLPWIMGWLLRDRRSLIFRSRNTSIDEMDRLMLSKERTYPCPLCDSLNRPSARFCGHCGAELDVLY